MAHKKKDRLYLKENNFFDKSNVCLTGFEVSLYGEGVKWLSLCTKTELQILFNLAT